MTIIGQRACRVDIGKRFLELADKLFVRLLRCSSVATDLAIGYGTMCGNLTCYETSLGDLSRHNLDREEYC